MIVSEVQAQSFYLRPYAGLQRFLCYVQSGDQDAATFKKNTYNDFMDVGVLIDYYRGRYGFSAGLTTGAAGYAFQVTNPNPVAIRRADIHLSSGMGSYRIPLQVTYTLTNYGLFPVAAKTPANPNATWLNGRIEVFGGRPTTGTGM